MKEIYVALSGAVAREKQLAAVTNNLANMNTIGFKRELAVFDVRPAEFDTRVMEQSHDAALNLPPILPKHQGDRTYTRLAETWIDHAQGVIRPSADNPLDLALEVRAPEGGGSAFFQVGTPQGPRLTRMGNFLVDAQGRLVLANGALALDANGNTITLPETARQNIRIDSGGAIFVGQDQVAQLSVQYVEQPGMLQPAGGGMFEDPSGQAGIRPVGAEDSVWVRQGFIEMSNVNPIEELVRMIDLQKNYTLAQKSIQSMDDATDKTVAAVLNG